METIHSILKVLAETPLPTILIVGGMAFLLLSVVGQIGSTLVVNPKKQTLAAVLGAVLLIAGILLHIPWQNSVPSDGRIVLRREDLSSRSWEFLHAPGDVISREVRLDPSGAILGIDHPNESRWGLDNGTLVFYHASGQPSTRFTGVQRESGKLRLTGRLLLPGDQPIVEHVLAER